MKNTLIKVSDNIVSNNNTITPYINSLTQYIPTGVNMCNAPLMWQQGYTGEGVKIAILDSGCILHQDLRGNIIGGKNFTSEGNSDNYNELFQDFVDAQQERLCIAKQRRDIMKKKAMESTEKLKEVFSYVQVPF